MMQTTLTSHILVFQNDAVLLVRHGDAAGHITGTYGIPGGHVEGDESLKKAAVREFREETGLEVLEEDLQEFPGNEYTADITRKTGETKRYTMHILLAEKFAGRLKSSGETTPEWISVDALDKYNLLPNVKNAILAAKEYRQHANT